MGVLLIIGRTYSMRCGNIDNCNICEGIVCKSCLSEHFAYAEQFLGRVNMCHPECNGGAWYESDTRKWCITGVQTPDTLEYKCPLGTNLREMSTKTKYVCDRCKVRKDGSTDKKCLECELYTLLRITNKDLRNPIGTECISKQKCLDENKRMVMSRKYPPQVMCWDHVNLETPLDINNPPRAHLYIEEVRTYCPVGCHNCSINETTREYICGKILPHRNCSENDLIHVVTFDDYMNNKTGTCIAKVECENDPMLGGALLMEYDMNGLDIYYCLKDNFCPYPYQMSYDKKLCCAAHCANCLFHHNIHQCMKCETGYVFNSSYTQLFENNFEMTTDTCVHIENCQHFYIRIPTGEEEEAEQEQEIETEIEGENENEVEQKNYKDLHCLTAKVCPTHYTQDLNKCCPPGCKTCSGIHDGMACLSCVDGYYQRIANITSVLPNTTSHVYCVHCNLLNGIRVLRRDADNVLRMYCLHEAIGKLLQLYIYIYIYMLSMSTRLHDRCTQWCMQNWGG